jgi:ABC-type multidrug transport system fused ATPase/permease subunit
MRENIEKKKQSSKTDKVGTLHILLKVMTTSEKVKFCFLMLLGIISAMAVLIPTQIISIIVSKLSGESIIIFGMKLSDDISYMTIILVGGLATFVMKTITATYDLSIEKLIKRVVANLRVKTYDWLVVPRKNMDLKMTQGDAIYRINQAPELVTDAVVDFFVSVVPEVLSAIIAFVYILVLDVQTITVLLIGIALVVASVITRTKIEKHISTRTEKAKSAMSSTIANTITNLPLIYLYKSMFFESSIFKSRVDNFFKEQKKQINLRWVYWLIVRFVEVASTFVIIYLCAKQVYLQTMLVGSIIVISNYVAQIFSPIQTIGYFAARWIQSEVALDRLMELKPAEKQLLPLSSEKSDSIETLELSHICAKNSGGFNLDNVNLKFQKGELVVISGESGCGKSTLIKLICGLAEKTSGDIIINGQKKISSGYKEVDNMSVSMQDAYIFNRDVKLNIFYPDGNVDSKGFGTIVDDLSLGNVINRKYDDDGEQTLQNMLSGGEKKRIGISRALIKKADVYIFDEPTNDLDNQNAKKVISSIQKLKENAIVIVVSHDDRVKEIADRLIVFQERGKLEENDETLN